jgi:hypothetical protein
MFDFEKMNEFYEELEKDYPVLIQNVLKDLRHINSDTIEYIDNYLNHIELILKYNSFLQNTRANKGECKIMHGNLMIIREKLKDVIESISSFHKWLVRECDDI